MRTIRIIVGIALVNVLLLTAGIALAVHRERAALPPEATAAPQPTGTPPAASGTPRVSVPPRVSSAPTPDNRCIITVDGIRYDVTSFRDMHSGGDVFVCGTDMSRLFHSQHGRREMQYLQRYRVP